MASALAAAVARLAEDTLLMVDPNCRPTRHRGPGCLPRPPDERPRPRRRRQGQCRRPGLHGAGSPAIDAARALLAVGAASRPADRWGTGGLGPRPRFEVELPVPRVAVVDTVGSGDAFGGAFLAWWMERGLGRDALADRGRRERGRDSGDRRRQPHLPASRRRPAHTYRGRLARPLTGPDGMTGTLSAMRHDALAAPAACLALAALTATAPVPPR